MELGGKLIKSSLWRDCHVGVSKSRPKKGAWVHGRHQIVQVNSGNDEPPSCESTSAQPDPPPPGATRGPPVTLSIAHSPRDSCSPSLLFIHERWRQSSGGGKQQPFPESAMFMEHFSCFISSFKKKTKQMQPC